MDFIQAFLPAVYDFFTHFVDTSVFIPFVLSGVLFLCVVSVFGKVLRL